MSKVLDIDCLLIQDKYVPSHTVRGLLELAQVDGLRLGHVLSISREEEKGGGQEQEEGGWMELQDKSCIGNF